MQKNNAIEFQIRKSKDKINYLQKMISLSIHPYYKYYYNQLLISEISRLRKLTDSLNSNFAREVGEINQREFTIDELAIYDGSNGKPAYIAVNGIVYDVSNEATWGGGTHFGLYAGKDVTNEFSSCHGSQEILINLPKVGVLR